jgi:hypothetical protein
MFSQPIKSSSLAFRISDPPKIDGKIDEDCWKELPNFEDFIQWGPYNGNPPSQQTTARVGYDDGAIYICGICYDDSPKNMRSEIGLRDSYTSNTESFAVHISPFNDGINSFFFQVSLAGVQRDVKFYGDHAIISWDAVWESEVEKTDRGWTVEMKIPFSALRFSNKSVQDWGFNIWRWIARNREWSCWSYVSNEIDCWWKEIGLLQGINNVSPPVRLSFMPFLSAYAANDTNNRWGNYFNGGLDLKYGLTNSFTLDMSLVPDFGQVESDEVELNLTPYEIKYNEKRQFFTEGMELFQKGEIFYSRRIGAQPVDHDNVYNHISDTEKVLNNPNETPLLNATKISGRTNGGLGLGLLNAMTDHTYATVQDIQTGKKRDILTQSFTNLNIFVIDQSLFENSYISFINSNVLRKGYMANVTAAEFKLADENNLYKLMGIGALSNITKDDTTTTGYKLALETGKTGGSFQYLYSLSVINDTYYQNDMGYLRRNNEIINQFSLNYNILKPHGIFLNIRNGLDILYGRIYSPSDFAEFTVRYKFSAEFKNHYSWGIQLALAPFEGHDYYETRTPNRYFIRNKHYQGQIALTTDSRQSLAVGLQGSYMNSYAYDFNIKSWHLAVTPTLRLNDKIKMVLDSSIEKNLNEPGFIERLTDTDLILFGKRDRQTLVNMLTVFYAFNSKAALNIRLRHYWSMVDYDSYYELAENGRLSPIDCDSNYDVNYNAFNIDMTFRWNFAPGSEILLNWKNAIHTSATQLLSPYWTNLKNALQAPQINSFSIKFIYYFDYFDIKKLFGRK